MPKAWLLRNNCLLMVLPAACPSHVSLQGLLLRMHTAPGRCFAALPDRHVCDAREFSAM